MKSSDDLARVSYFEGQFLRPQDLAEEQAHQVAMRRRHNIAHHSWGIVRGLELRVEEGTLLIEPGMAVDGYGRELVLPQRRMLSVRAFDEKHSDVLDVWLHYGRRDVELAPPGYSPAAGVAPPAYRALEDPSVRLSVPAPPGESDRRRPPGVEEGDLGFKPTRQIPDAVERQWPVFLGQVARDPANAVQPFSVSLADRPYAGLVGEALVSPSGAAWVEIGSPLMDHPGARPATGGVLHTPIDPRRRFAVFVAPPDSANGNVELVPVLKVDDAGDLELRSDTTVFGDLKVAHGAIEFAAGAEPGKAQPWRIYRTSGPASSGPPAFDELRIEIDSTAPGARLVVGRWDHEEKKFKPCLTVDQNCKVIVHGDLILKGRLVQDDAFASPAVVAASVVVGASALSATAVAEALVALDERTASEIKNALEEALEP